MLIAVVTLVKYFFVGYCGIQYSQAVPYTSPDSFDLSSLSTVTGAVNVSFSFHIFELTKIIEAGS